MEFTQISFVIVFVGKFLSYIEKRTIVLLNQQVAIQYERTEREREQALFTYS